MALFSCSESTNESKYYNVKGEAQGTTYSITYKDSLGRNFQTQIDSILTAIDNSVSTYVPESIISKFNAHNDTTWFEIDAIFYQNMVLSKKVNTETHVFDPTVRSLYHYYKFDTNDAIGIDSAKIDSILTKHVGIAKLEVKADDGRYFIKKSTPNISIDFNAIAQGHSVDLIAAFLQSKHLHNYMVEVGGELCVKGKNPSNNAWVIAIEKPTETETQGEELQLKIKLNERALATSGSYRKYKLKDGKRYSHAIHPLSGLPVTHNTLSVSVIAESTALADAYATAFLVLAYNIIPLTGRSKRCTGYNVCLQ
jgi:thiamine biosynthesis lipoprotein